MALRQVTEQAWQIGFQSLEAENPEEAELEVEGSLPKELRGRLYRVGPARFDVYGERYRHWFDGDGMVHSLRLVGGRAYYRNRFVSTTKKVEEDAARRRLYGTVGTPPTGGPLARVRRAMPPRSVANTNIVFHGGRLLALWEAARPWRIDPHTLETMGEDDLGGLLRPGAAFSAHPHLDPANGDLWNFGTTYGPRTVVTVYRGRVDGTVERVAHVPLPHGAWVHDFALTATKVVLIVPPLTLPRIPLGLLSGQRSYASSLRWRPGLGTRIAVMDRASTEVRWFRSDPFMMFHTVNAWDDDGDVVVDVCAFEDAAVMSTLTEVMRGELRTQANAWPERLRLSRNGTVRRSRLSSTTLEFPRVADHAFTRPQTRIYGATVFEGGALEAAPVAIDLAAGTVSKAPLAPGEFGGEPVPVAKERFAGEADVWLLAVVLNAAAGRSELRVYDGAEPAAGAVATVPLPHVVPFHFHGNWVGEEELAGAS